MPGGAGGVFDAARYGVSPYSRRARNGGCCWILFPGRDAAGRRRFAQSRDNLWRTGRHPSPICQATRPSRPNRRSSDQPACARVVACAPRSGYVPDRIRPHVPTWSDLRPVVTGSMNDTAQAAGALGRAGDASMCRESCATRAIVTDASASGVPWPRSDGYARA